jgi:uncharacterized membrane protein YfcA
MITAILGVLGILTIWFAFVFVKDYMANKNNLEENSFGKAVGIGFATDFFDTLGIGSFAPTTALLKFTKQTADKFIPGTLNVSHTIPVVMEAFIFITVITVEPVTLISLLAAAVVGAWIGAGIISKLPEKKIQITMGIALAATAIIMLLSKLGLMPGGGDAIGLSGMKLVIGVVGNFILGALMTAGIGLYAPCMALIYFLGMSPDVAFPIMMGSCAFLMPVAGVRFVKEASYDRKTSMGITIGGIVGVIIAAYLVKSLPIDILKWIVIAVIAYTSVTMLRSASKNKEEINQ